jgi:hypothetical protein
VTTPGSASRIVAGALALVLTGDVEAAATFVDSLTHREAHEVLRMLLTSSAERAQDPERAGADVEHATGSPA